MLHHTAGRDNSAGMRLLRDGRTGVPGPLANVGVRKDGTLAVVTNTRANHAGRGSSYVLNETRRGIAPRADAAKRGLSNNANGNGYYYGFEIVNLGDGRDPYPQAQLNAVFDACAAICIEHGWTAARVIMHREWTSRKIDPSWKLDARAAIQQRIDGTTEPPTPEPEEPEDDMLEHGDNKPEVAQLRHLVNRLIEQTGGWPGGMLPITNEYDDALAERLWHAIARTEQWLLHHPLYSESSAGTRCTAQTQSWLTNASVALTSGALRPNTESTVTIDDRFEPLEVS